ncbi:MAG TPA: zf-HC2 domain-containing protein [Isosphaeraceae bacterium]|jgi:hypothetical protein|nr:zf-HC2 domain-containing protein [Isosphaeraceae bacterium]
MWDNRCAWMQNRLPLLAGGELVGPDRRRVERHLLLCVNCRKRMTAHREALDALRTAAELPPVAPDRPSLWPSLARQIQESRRPAPATAWSFFQPRVAIFSTAAALGLVLGSVWLLQSRTTVLTPQVNGSSPQQPASALPPQQQPAPLPVHLADSKSVHRRTRKPKVRDTSSPADATPPTRTVVEPDRTLPQPTDTRDTQ